MDYVGHPLFDVGVATIAAYVRKPNPASIDDDDLARVARFLAEEYVVDPLKSFLNVAFPNSGFTNPAFEKTPEKRTAYAERVLYGYRCDPASGGQKCVFTGNPALGIAFSDKIAAGRCFRQHVPLLTGEGVINFYPWGDAGMPISGQAMLAIQAFPMGCAKCGGKLLAVHSDNPDLIYDFAAEFLEQNRRALSLAHQERSKKMPEAKSSAKTLLIETLLEIERRRLEAAEDSRPASVTAYHLTNSGQSNPLDSRNPPLEIYHLPLQMTDFLAQVAGPEYRNEWQGVCTRAWWLTRPKKGDKKEQTANTERPGRNVLYEDLFLLPQNCRSFVQRYFLRLPIRTARDDDPRRAYSLRGEAALVSWKLTSLFLKKVMGMKDQRIEQIRALGDRLAEYVSGENDRRFFSTFFAEKRYDLLRDALIKANLRQVKSGKPPLVTLDPYVQVFEDGDEQARADWRLARDLVLIRLIEQLYAVGWLGRNVDAIPQDFDEATASA